MSETPQAFLDAVTAWIRTHGEPTATVVKVAPYGTDWRGDTNSGFYSYFDVSIWFTRGDEPEQQFLEVRGERLESLWTDIIRGYGSQS